jgi:hypothetical protein
MYNLNPILDLKTFFKYEAHQELVIPSSFKQEGFLVKGSGSPTLEGFGP